MRQGNGTLKNPSGAIYKGEWLENRRHGRGSQRYADGSTYEG